MADNDNPGEAQPPIAAQLPPMTASAPPTGNMHFKLPDFWSENQGLWFAQVECIWPTGT
jgi:hypothetical protein